VNRYLSAYALTFSTDKISEVRTSGVHMLAEVLALFIRVEWAQHQEEILAEDVDISNFLPLAYKFLREIRAGFWNTRVWRRRQSFAKMLAALASKRLITAGQFLRLMFHDFMDVSRDEVTNVRQFFCAASSSLIRNKQITGGGGSHKDISTELEVIIERLEQIAGEDADSEIRRQAERALMGWNPSA